MSLCRNVVGLLSVVVLFLQVPLRAWGPVGHEAIARIAQDRLSAEARREIRAILGDGISLDQIANCPDIFLHDPHPVNCGGVFTIPSDAVDRVTAGWHFIDIPRSAHPDKVSLMEYCPEPKSCVVEQINRNLAILSDRSRALRDRQMALMYVVHFVADEHQPLHCADDDDRGGNAKLVEFMGHKMNLHGLWDDGINPPGQVSYKLPADSLSAKSAQIAKKLEKAIKSADAASWGALTDPGAVSLESFHIAQTVIYPAYHPTATDPEKNEPIAVVGKDYQKQMKPIADERMEMAGVRLAALLEKALVGP